MNLWKNKAFVGLVVCCGLLVSHVSGQNNKLIPNAGFTYQFITQKYKLDGSNPSIFPFYGFTAGLDYVITHSNDQFSLVANPNANFAFTFSSLYGTYLLAQAPMFIKGKIGAGATPFNETKFGISAGVGLTYTYANYLDGNFDRVKESFINPAGVAEVTIRSRMGTSYTIRVNWSFSPVDLEISNNIYQFSTFGLSIVYGF